MPESETPAAESPKKDVGFATPAEAIAAVRPLQEKLGAVAGKTPGTVVRAFLPDELKVYGIVLKPIRMRTWMYLEKINSPLIQGQAINPTLEDLLRGLYVITQPGAEVGAAIRAGEEMFAEAVDEFSEHIPISALAGLAVTLADHIAAEFEPKADMVRNEEGSGSGPKPIASSATVPGPGSPFSTAS